MNVASLQKYCGKFCVWTNFMMFLFMFDMFMRVKHTTYILLIIYMNIKQCKVNSSQIILLMDVNLYLKDMLRLCSDEGNNIKEIYISTKTHFCFHT